VLLCVTTHARARDSVPGRSISVRLHGLMRNVLAQAAHTHVLRSTQPAAPRVDGKMTTSTFWLIDLIVAAYMRVREEALGGHSLSLVSNL